MPTRSRGAQANSIGYSRAAFSLLEVVIVVVILGVIGAIAVPRFSRAASGASEAAFIRQLSMYARAVDKFQAKTGEYPPDFATGTVTGPFTDFVDAERWAEPTPIGGLWDIEFASYGVTSAVGVAKTGGLDTNQILRIDRVIDDGNVVTGSARFLDGTSRYYIVIAE